MNNRAPRGIFTPRETIIALEILKIDCHSQNHECEHRFLETFHTLNILYSEASL